jgi:hypothetical protein
MKRIFDGVTYNTETATRLAQSTWERDGAEVTGVLYQTRGGAFFVHEFWTKEAWIERLSQTEERDYNEFIPLSAAEAQAWIMEGEVEVFSNPFDDPPEATAEPEPGATIYIRVPASLKQRVDKAADAAKVSGNVWAMKCVERCLDPRNALGKKDIARAHYILFAINARIDKGLTTSQIAGLAMAATEELEGAWIDLGFDEADIEIPTQMMAAVDEDWRRGLIEEYAPPKHAADQTTRALPPATSNATVDRPQSTPSMRRPQSTPLPERTLTVEVKKSPPKR